MILKVFTVYDVKVGAFLRPFFMATTGAAIRAFRDILRDLEHDFSRNPADFTLFEIGTFSEETAEFAQESENQPLGTALEHQAALREELIATPLEQRIKELKDAAE